MPGAKFLVAAFAALALAVSASGDPPPQPAAKNPGPGALVAGTWSVRFANGVVESCEFKCDGTTSESEPKRAATGTVENKDGAIVITFSDDRVERWTAVDKQMVVEHWFPGAQYPAGPKVLGIASREAAPPAALTGDGR